METSVKIGASAEEEAGVASLWDKFKRGEVEFFQVERTKNGRIVTKHAGKVHAAMYTPKNKDEN